MALRLTKKYEQLLEEILTKRRPEMLGFLDPLGDLRVSNKLLDELRQIVSDEFSETGLRDDDEPNYRGLLLEALIDELGRLQF